MSLVMPSLQLLAAVLALSWELMFICSAAVDTWLPQVSNSCTSCRYIG
jgi:hypothetical protein